MKFLKWWWQRYDIGETIQAAIIFTVVVGTPFGLYIALASWEKYTYNTNVFEVAAAVLWCVFLICVAIALFVDKLRGIKREYDRHKRSDQSQQIAARLEGGVEMSENEIKHKGLFQKFVVKRNNGEEVSDPLFVLLPEKDPSARHALKQYADHVKAKNPVLAEDIYRWIAEGEQRLLQRYYDYIASSVNEIRSG